MGSLAALREPVRSIVLPPNVPAAAILGQRGKLVNRVRQLTGAAIKYRPEDHRVDINGSPRDVGAAARLLERTLEHYQYSGLQFARKQISNILGPELSDASSLRLQPSSRPISTLLGPVDGFVLSPVEDPASGPAAGRQQPGASTSTSTSDGAPPASGSTSPLIQLKGDLDACLQQLVDLAAEISVRHPAECDRAEIRLYLGKLYLTDVVSSSRVLSPEALSGWTFQRNARTVFETSLPQETIRSLDRYLTSRGLAPTQQSKSASLHLESSINWIQYHPTFSVGSGGELRLSKLETLGCKPLTVALVGPPGRPDVRMRYVASVQHGEDDPVAAELRRRQGEFALVNNVQVIVPNDLHAMDLTLTSARVKLKRVYASPTPLPPPSPPSPSPSPSTSSSSTTRRPRTSKRAAAASSSDPELPAVSLKVSVAAVVDNLGGKRLEVTVGCPELNATLLGMHRARQEAPGQRHLLAAQLRSVLAHMDELRRNVEFEP
ncbi:Poly(rC)-binding protein 3 [Pleodorina starrii]|uniref:Poly(RC)-binding protein 3 n=1 Tax=Pleodorina starrii TaxID=330485 RepID=A0A9W6BPZ6_9CHLO|nr:Poly(rC)-binding protein 3 [Pleodorina starrii]GLC56164.1 Poly(rC)-binding protein 3 [Pleodorina starrii]GLC74951.1 Poly(rC)-binding protein 3 [Pleodorina starrii]